MSGEMEPPDVKNRLITVELQPFWYDSITMKGNTVGSRPIKRIDPVTTEGESLRVEMKSRPTRRSLEQTASNQLAAYLSGYVDGEGCFSVSLSPRATLTTGWEVRPSFSVSQNADRASFLYEIQNYFDRGTIRPDRSDKTVKYEVRSLDNLVKRIIPHFQQFPL